MNIKKLKVLSDIRRKYLSVKLDSSCAQQSPSRLLPCPCAAVNADDTTTVGYYPTILHGCTVNIRNLYIVDALDRITFL